jgi:hypothetical protein
MRRWLPAAAAVVLTLGLAAFVRANAPAPPPPPPNVQFGARDAKIVVETDDKAKQPRLVVPATLLGGPPKPGAAPGQAQLPTIMAGVALTLAFVTGGFWLLRKGPGRSLVLLFALSLVVAGASAVQADLARPPQTTPVKLPADVKLSGNQITLEVVPRGDSIKLIVPKDAVKPAAKPEEQPKE